MQPIQHSVIWLLLFAVLPLKLFPKVVRGASPQSCAPKIFSKAFAINLWVCTKNGSPKPFCTEAPESCASKLLPDAAVQCYCPKPATFQTYTPKRPPKAILQSASRKLLPKVATKSCSLKLFVMLPWKMPFFKVIVPESCSGQPAKAAPQSFCPQLLPHSCDSSNLYRKTSPQNYSAKWLPKAAPDSYPPNWFVNRQDVLVVVLTWGYAVMDSGLQFLGRNKEQPCAPRAQPQG